MIFYYKDLPVVAVQGTNRGLFLASLKAYKRICAQNEVAFNVKHVVYVHGEVCGIK